MIGFVGCTPDGSYYIPEGKGNPSCLQPQRVEDVDNDNLSLSEQGREFDDFFVVDRRTAWICMGIQFVGALIALTLASVLFINTFQCFAKDSVELTLPCKPIAVMYKESNGDALPRTPTTCPPPPFIGQIQPFSCSEGFVKEGNRTCYNCTVIFPVTEHWEDTSVVDGFNTNNNPPVNNGHTEVRRNYVFQCAEKAPSLTYKFKVSLYTLSYETADV